MSAISRLCDRRMLSQRPAGLSMVLRAFCVVGFVCVPGPVPFAGAGSLWAKRAERWRRECLQIEESLSAVSWLCDRRMLPQRPAGLSMVLRAFLRRGLCPRPGGCSHRGVGPFCVQGARNGGAGMSANRGKFVSSIAALRLERTLPQRPAGLPPVFSRPFLRRGLCPRPGACPHRGGGPFCVAAREAWWSVGKAGRTAGDRPVCVAARGNCDNFRINRLYFTFSANIYMCFTVLCHERQSLRIYCLMSIGDNDTDIWRERS